jgi:hypothetical protein
MTEVYFDTEQPLQPLVVLEQDVIVGGHASPLRVSLLDPAASSRNILLRRPEYLLHERHPQLAIHHHKQDTVTTPATHNEVTFSMTHTPSFVDILGPFLNPDAILPWFGPGLVSSVAQTPFASQVLKHPAMHAFDVSVYRIF